MLSCLCFFLLFLLSSRLKCCHNVSATRTMASVRSQKHWENIPWSSRLCICVSVLLQLLRRSPPAAPPLPSVRSDEIRMYWFCRFLVWWLRENTKADLRKRRLPATKKLHIVYRLTLQGLLCLPLMISSFTLCNSRTTSSKISCGAVNKLVSLISVLQGGPIIRFMLHGKLNQPVSSCQTLCLLH